MREHDWIWLEEAFEERAATFYRTGDSEPAEVFERLAATAANVPAVLMEQQQKLWDADAKAVARVWENVLNESDLPHRGLDGRGRSASNAQQDHGNPKPRDHRNGPGQIGHKRGALELTSRSLWLYGENLRKLTRRRNFVGSITGNSVRYGGLPPLCACAEHTHMRDDPDRCPHDHGSADDVRIAFDSQSTRRGGDALPLINLEK